MQSGAAVCTAAPLFFYYRRLYPYPVPDGLPVVTGHRIRHIGTLAPKPPLWRSWPASPVQYLIRTLIQFSRCKGGKTENSPYQPFTEDNEWLSSVKDRQGCLSQFKTIKNGFHQLELEFLVQVFVKEAIDRAAGIVQFKLAEFQHISLIMAQNLFKRRIITIFRLYDGG